MVRRIVSISFLIFCLLIAGFVVAQQSQVKTQQPAAKTQQPVQVQHQSVGKIVTMQSAKLPKFDKPITKPHITKPPDRDGGHWHWHPNFGWVLLAPDVGVPTELVLPETYALPANVVYYEVQATTPPLSLQVTCPNCGRTFQIQIQH